MSDISYPDTRLENTEPQTDVGIGFIFSGEYKADLARDIRRADRRGHSILVTGVNGSGIDTKLIDNLPTKITLLPSAQTAAKARDTLVEYAESNSLSGLIIQDSSVSRIDYERCYAALEEDRFTVEVEPIDAQIKGNQESIAAIIPAYNESESVRDVVLTTKPYVDDVIIIDDSSTDDTGKIARKCADKIISHPKNMGVGGAVHTGYLAAARSGYDIVVQIDADGQHDPSHIPRMVELIHDHGADMVIGSRWLNESYQQYSFLRRLGIRFFTREVNMIAGTSITDVTSGFRAYRVSKLENLGRPANSHWAVEQTLEAARQKWNIEEISVPMPPSVDGSQFDLETFVKYPPRMVFTTLKVLLFR